MPTRRAAAAARPEITPVVEEYLATIYLLGSEGEPVIGARLARRLGVAPASVTEMLKRLQAAGLVRLTPTKAIELTEVGYPLAEALVRRHRLAERWLTDELGLDWSEAQGEAAKLRHALSPRVEERLAASLGEPETCPHGNPIPGRAGRRPRGGVALARAELDVALVVDRIGERLEQDPEALRAIEAAGIVPGVRLYVRAIDEVAGTVTIERAGRRATLPLEAARGIFLRDPLPPDAETDDAEADADSTYVVDVASVDGWCRAHHQRGDRFEIGHCSPSGLCVEALAALHPRLEQIRRRARAGGPTVADIPCPEDGTVTFRVEFKRTAK